MRCALIAACASGALGGMVIAPGAPVAAKGVPRCHKGEVKRTIVYRKKVGGRARKVTGCVPRSLPATATASAAGLGQIRAFADRFAPASYMRLLKTPAGRRLRAADAATDAALARTAGFGVTVQAASTNHPNQQTMDSPPGTTSIIYGEGVTSLDTQYEVGALFEATTETTSNRIGGQSSKRYKFLKSKHLMNRCPGADGIAHGTLSASLREVTSIDTGDGRHVTRTQESAYEGTVDATFDEGARITKVEVKGEWTFSTKTNSGGSSVKGTTATKDFHQSPTPGKNPGEGYDNYIDIGVTTTTATDDGVAVAGNVAGAYAMLLPEHYVEKALLDPLQIRVLGGACEKIVPNSATVHVRPGGTVPIVAHLIDIHEKPFTGTISAYNGNDRVSPTSASADTDATFTYRGLSTPPSGNTDTVQLSHVSHHGRALSRTGLVTVVYDKTLFPKRYDGTWTRVIAPKQGYAPTETIQGTASFVRNPLIGPEAEGRTQIPYSLDSSSVHWSMTGTFTSGGCTTTYSGEGNDQGNLDGASGLLVEDVSNKPTDPKPEPFPFYYFVTVVDNTTRPSYNITSSGPDPPCTNSTDQRLISGHYLRIGELGSFESQPPPDDILKSGDIAHLDGHKLDDRDDQQTIEDRWSFTGSF